MLETPARIEPALFEEHLPERLVNLAGDVSDAARELGRALHPQTRTELAGMVRVLNSYYSNLIEGHNTRPRDIERVLAGDLEAVEPAKRSLAIEAGIHVHLQERIDRQAENSTLPDATSVAFLTGLHRDFYADMPMDLRTVRSADGRGITVAPGAMRSRPEHEVAIGDHLPPSSERVANFMDAFELRYRAPRKPISRILAMPVAHHRFNYIHPFPDGNGRVSRLMSHAMAHEAGIGAGGLWSISRGLSRGLRERSEYKRMMAYADMARQGDRDGRGNLSERALIEFSEWFLAVALDQVRFVSGLFALGTLEDRIVKLVDRLGLDPRGKRILSAVLRYGEMPRGEASTATGAKERTARTILSELTAVGLLRSDGPKTPVRLAFPRDHHEVLFPSLFADGY